MTDVVSKIKYLYCQKVLPLVYDDSLSYYETICKFQQKLNEVIDSIEGLTMEVLEQANAYTDSAIARQQADIDRIVRELRDYVEQTKREFDDRLDDVQAQYDRFERNVNATITIFNNRLDDLADTLHAEIMGVNARTDLAIQQNNDYIFQVISEDLPSELKVINLFTGARVSVQEMFNYLATLHITDGITHTVLSSRNKTYAQLRDLRIDYTELATHGNSLIV